MSDQKDAAPNDEVDAAVDANFDESAEEATPAHVEIAKLKADVVEANERVLRSQAELENFRRRTRRELDEANKFANQPLLADLLPVIDNIERAIDSAQQAEGAGLLEGVQMVSQQLISVFEKHHCKRIVALGKPFDPSLHEAISQMPSEEHTQGNVMLEAQQGYQLHERVIRPTQVIVSTGPQEDPEA